MREGGEERGGWGGGGREGRREGERERDTFYQYNDTVAMTSQILNKCILNDY